MKKIHAFLFLFLLSPLSFADSLELNIFSNGQVADADEVNENFQLLETALNTLQGDSACATAADVVCPTPNSFDITIYNQGISDGFSSGVSSVDITTDNQSSYDDGFSAGVSSIDITSDNEAVCLGVPGIWDEVSKSCSADPDFSTVTSEVHTDITFGCCLSLQETLSISMFEIDACQELMFSSGPQTQCTADQLPISTQCIGEVSYNPFTVDVASRYFCGGRVESCEGSACDAIESCKSSDFECQFTINGTGSVSCGIGSLCTVITPSNGSFNCGFGADCTTQRLNGGTVTCEAGSECVGNVRSGVLNCKSDSTCNGSFDAGSVYCHDGATCTAGTGTGSDAVTMYCESGATCTGSASTGSAHTTMVCASGSDCSGGPSTGSSKVTQACEVGATCACSPGISNSSCVSGNFADYTFPEF